MATFALLAPENTALGRARSCRFRMDRWNRCAVGSPKRSAVSTISPAGACAQPARARAPNRNGPKTCEPGRTACWARIRPRDCVLNRSGLGSRRRNRSCQPFASRTQLSRQARVYLPWSRRLSTDPRRRASVRYRQQRPRTSRRRFRTPLPSPRSGSACSLIIGASGRSGQDERSVPGWRLCTSSRNSGHSGAGIVCVRSPDAWRLGSCAAAFVDSRGQGTPVGGSAPMDRLLAGDD